MLSAKDNERLTGVGPGTPGGNYLRRHWHPIAAAKQLEDKPVRGIRLLGEEFVLFRDLQGRYGLLEERCAHRQVQLKYGYPAELGLRCPYHGWTYDVTGQCVEQLAESNPRFKDKVKIPSYPVQEFCGMIWAYIGPLPAPFLPKWEPLVAQGLVRYMHLYEVPCNYMQMRENAFDWAHVIPLHGHFTKWLFETLGKTDDVRYQNSLQIANRPGGGTRESAWEYASAPYGIKRSVPTMPGRESDLVLPTGHTTPAVPGTAVFTWYTPIDDTHTQYWMMLIFNPGPDVSVPQQAELPFYEESIYDERGEFRREILPLQDVMVFVAQGAITDRSKEILGTSDIGLRVFRKLMLDEIGKVEQGEDPMNCFRNAADAECVPLAGTPKPFRGEYVPGSVIHAWGDNVHSPTGKAIEALAREAARKAAELR